MSFLCLKAAGVVQLAPWEEISEGSGPRHLSGPASHCAHCYQRYLTRKLSPTGPFTGWLHFTVHHFHATSILNLLCLFCFLVHNSSLSFIFSPALILINGRLLSLSSLSLWMVPQFKSWVTQVLMRAPPAFVIPFSPVPWHKRKSMSSDILLIWVWREHPVPSFCGSSNTGGRRQRLFILYRVLW